LVKRSELAAGRPSEAREHLAAVATAVEEAGIRDPAAYRFEADYIESLILCGEIEVASRRLADFEPSADDQRPWRRATAARCRALLAAATGDAAAADLADEAVALHESLGMPVELGRALLLAGRLHRARKGKRAAAERLTRAARVFEAAGASAWRVRALGELARVGLRPRAPHELTATESEVATLAAQGLTNRQVADALVMSPRSIDAVLGRVYQKLGIRSRAELGARFAEPAEATEQHR
jgi:DNA-binding NarL/FixJ family response regulator